MRLETFQQLCEDAGKAPRTLGSRDEGQGKAQLMMDYYFKGII